MADVEMLKNMIRQILGRFEVDKVKLVEARMNECDKISLYYLLNDNPAESLSVLNSGVDEAVSSWCYRLAQVKRDEWKLRFIESLMLMQMYRCLELLGYKKTDLTEVRNLLDMALRSKDFDVRKALYSAVDTMTAAELERFVQAMDGEMVSRVYPTSYIEFYLLEWQKEGRIRFEEKSLNDLVARLDNLQLKCASESLKRSLKGLEYACFEDYIVHNSVTTNKTVTTNDVITDVSVTEKQYPIYDKERIGLCIILNQETYLPKSGHSSRDGSMFDVKKLVETMTNMKLECQVLSNLRGDHIFPSIRYTVLHHFRKTVHSVLFVVIMAHGDIDKVYGVDGKPVNISCRSSLFEDNIGITLSSDKLNCLTNIPKVIIFQACRGKLHKGEADTGGRDEAYYTGSFQDDPLTPKSDNIEADGMPEVKPWMDHYIMCFPNVIGFKAYRVKNEGSPYIQKLCDYFLALFKKHDVYSILTRVNGEFNQESNKLILNGQTVAMLPEITSTLTMPLFLYPR